MDALNIQGPMLGLIARLSNNNFKETLYELVDLKIQYVTHSLEF